MTVGWRLRQHIFEPLHGLISHSPKLHYWREIEKTQYLPESQLREIQWQRLQEMLGIVAEQNPYYRHQFAQAKISPFDIKTPEDFLQIPILTKADIRRSGIGMITDGYSVDRLHKAKTGGSTGKSLELFFTEECSELRNACARRHDRWTGWEPGEPIAACWGNPHLPTTLKAKLRQALLQPMVYLDTMSVNQVSVTEFVREWRRLCPTLLYGHAHSIYLLAQHLKQMGIEDLLPRGILSTSMMLLPSERKVIEDVFSTKAIDRYGCEEVGLIGCECEKHEGMHLNIEHLFVEFIKDDGSPCEPGETGRIVVTDLVNKAMPLVRYQVEDIGAPTKRQCSCGRGLPLMDSLMGRVADFLQKRDGTSVAGISLIEKTLTCFPGLDQMQIIQQKIDLFEINIVPGKLFSAEVLDDLRRYLEIVFGDGIAIKFFIKKQILPELSGKFRFSICRI
ncbi:phenylacetate--CoA ligase family protein [Desulfuromonas sp. AOP6]|uniref:phenylacetate--CoA ligase family protein n=1 Tax=Desulfuromonas sp. AOP6 TaxID=1566351 RepID=UPI0012701537|nr:phenylacetate--CoA ligase family protein [Desulfuromonas sp. AOP6]BCA79501.1 adenylyltransferase [Desulfuromonas sp. AOP6]